VKTWAKVMAQAKWQSLCYLFLNKTAVIKITLSKSGSMDNERQ